MKRWLVGVLVVVAASGCDIRPSGPMRVTLPAPAGQALASVGIPMVSVEGQLLSTISPTSGVIIQQEWERAPDMLMVSMNNRLAANLDQQLQFLPGLAPLERDFVSCGRTESGHVEFPIPTAPRYHMPEIPLQRLPDGGVVDVAELGRGGATITSLSIRPQNVSDPALSTVMLVDGTVEATSFNFAVTMSNLNLDFRRQGWDYQTTIGSLGVTCVATIEPETVGVPVEYRSCGEQRVRCLPGTTTVTVTGFNTTFPGFYQVLSWLFGEALFTGFVRNAVEMGMTLHQQNWAITSMSFANNAERSLHIVGASTVDSAGDSVCSPVPPPPPPAPPTRALVEGWGIAGEGELISQHGYVRPFKSVPVLNFSAYDTARHGYELVKSKDLVGPDPAGGEFWPEPYGVLATATRLARRDVVDEKECWVKPATVATVTFLDPREYVATIGGRAQSAEHLEKLKDRSMRITSVGQLNPEDARRAAKQLGIDCGECTGWTRVTGILAGHDDLPWGVDGLPPGGPAPWEIEVWISRDLAEMEASLGPQLKCEESLLNYEVRRRLFTLPRVALYDTYFDSAAVNSFDHLPTVSPAHLAFESSFADGSKQRRLVGLAEACPANGVICWEGVVKAPESGTASVIVAGSETSVPRLDVANAVAGVGGTVATYGARMTAAWGYFDRSAVELYTRVPEVYRRAGVSPDGYDYRGSADLDWTHQTSTFPEPNSRTHIDASRPTWLNVDPAPGEGYQGDFRPYFADWANDEVQLRRRRAGTASFCALPEQLSARISTLRFTGAGLSSVVDRPVSQVMPTNSGNDVVITGSQTASGRPRLSVP